MKVAEAHNMKHAVVGGSVKPLVVFRNAKGPQNLGEDNFSGQELGNQEKERSHQGYRNTTFRANSNWVQKQQNALGVQPPIQKV